jgi:hypothetical protein
MTSAENWKMESAAQTNKQKSNLKQTNISSLAHSHKDNSNGKKMAATHDADELKMFALDSGRG